jgi:hypothetical protein
VLEELRHRAGAGDEPVRVAPVPRERLQRARRCEVREVAAVQRRFDAFGTSFGKSFDESQP